MEEEVYEQYEVASWTPDGGSTVTFPVVSIRERRGKRIVKQPRTYRDGAKLDDTGWDVRIWEVRCEFNNSIEEEGLGETPALYPDRLNQLIRSFDKRATGDVRLPTRGLKRCRAASYDRVEEATLRDEAIVTFSFEEDSEDAINSESLQDPSVRASAVRLTEQTQFSTESIGSKTEVPDPDAGSSFLRPGGDGIGSLVSLANDVEDTLTAPARYVGDVKKTSDRSKAALKHVAETEERVGKEYGGFFSHPESHEAQMENLEDRDLQAKAVAEKNSDQPPTEVFQVSAPTDIFSIAAEVNQDPNLLMQMNGAQIADPFNIQPGETVLVLQRTT